ncbi:MAG: glycoside hydrolase family 15 protein [Deltaproteobacteria bacterium]|nr:glycoside hydrolase family 15 protein [Deltaproteobacteria bacterium]
MPRDIPVGNGHLLVTHDSHYRIRDIYFPCVGKENHTSGHGLRFGVWVDGTLHWTNHSWKFDLDYVSEGLVTRVEGVDDVLEVKLSCNDAVDYRENVYLKKITLTNLSDRGREFRIFFYHDFHILENPAGDTAYYDPDEEALIHYKANRYFLMSGMRDGRRGFDQFATGVKEFNQLEGTCKDAADGWLEGNPITQGSVDSTLAIWITVPGKGEQTFYYWMAAGTSYAEVSRLNRLVLGEGPEFFIGRTEKYWRAWVNKEEFNLETLPKGVVDLFKKSLLILRTNIDAGGAIIAGNDSTGQGFVPDTYSYMWPRDAAFTAHALDLAGNIGVTRRFFHLCVEIISRGKEAGGYFLHKYHPDGSLGSSWHPWIAGGEKQLPIQEDGTGLVLWALWNHFNRYRDIELSAKIYEDLGYRCGDFLASYRDPVTGLPHPSFDLWEEQWGIHTFTVSAVHAGLRAAGNFAEFFSDSERATRYRKAADEVKAAMDRYLYSDKEKRFLRCIMPEKDGAFREDPTVDASLYAPFYLGVYGPRDEKVVSTMEAIRSRLTVQTESGGIARYEGDRFHRPEGSGPEIPGNPWFICTLWYAQWQIARAESLMELQEAIPILEWAVSRALPSGVLSEQVDPHTNRQLSVSPLTWSHATYVAAFLEYLHKLEELFTCPCCGRSLYRHDRGGREQHKGKVWKKVHKAQEQELGRPLTYLTHGEVEFEGRKATISVDDKRCVGATMCAFTCPVAIFELVDDKARLVQENLHRCLLQTCMNCRDNCPTHAISIEFHD